MKIYPILNNLGKGKYVFIFILNERAVALSLPVGLIFAKKRKKPGCGYI